MSHLSPMMERVRRDGIVSSLKIPRKGRIRVFLLVVFIGVIVWVKFSGTVNTNDSIIDERKVKTTKVKKEKTQNAGKVNYDKSTQATIKKKPEPEFTIAVVGSLLSRKKTSFDIPYDTINFAKRNLVLHYSIDTTLQKRGNILMKRYKPRYGAIVAINPVNGRILSLVSWKHDSVSSLGGALYSKGIFPAASIYKTITAAAAIETAEFTAKTTIKHTGRNHTLYNYQLESELKVFKDVLFEDAYANSYNPVFGRIGMYALQKGTLVTYGKRFGFNSDVPFELPVEMSVATSPDSNLTVAELASGFNQKTTLSPILGALIASAISENGRMPQPSIVDSISENDSTLYKVEPKLWKTTVSSKTADVVKGLMLGVSRYGTARQSFSTIKRSAQYNDIEYGGKTGSIDKDSTGRVDWFIGFARHPVDKRQRIAVGIITVHGAYWTVHSSYIAAELIKVYLRSIQLEDEKKQKEILSSNNSN